LREEGEGRTKKITETGGQKTAIHWKAQGKGGWKTAIVKGKKAVPAPNYDGGMEVLPSVDSKGVNVDGGRRRNRGE